MNALTDMPPPVKLALWRVAQRDAYALRLGQAETDGHLKELQRQVKKAVDNL